MAYSALACNDARRTEADWMSDSCRSMYSRCFFSQKDGSTRRPRPREEMHAARMSSCVSRYRYEITWGERGHGRRGEHLHARARVPRHRHRSHLVENGRSHLAPELRDNPSQSGPSPRCTHLVEDSREHAAHGLLVRSELLHIGRERLGGEGQAPWWALGMHSHARAPW